MVKPFIDVVAEVNYPVRPLNKANTLNEIVYHACTFGRLLTTIELLPLAAHDAVYVTPLTVSLRSVL